MKEIMNREDKNVIVSDEHLPSALFINLKTQKIESHRPDRIRKLEQYVLLSDLLAK